MDNLLGFFCKEDQRDRLVSGPRDRVVSGIRLVGFYNGGNKSLFSADGKAPVKGENG